MYHVCHVVQRRIDHIVADFTPHAVTVLVAEPADYLDAFQCLGKLGLVVPQLAGDRQHVTFSSLPLTNRARTVVTSLTMTMIGHSRRPCSLHSQNSCTSPSIGPTSAHTVTASSLSYGVYVSST